MHGLDKPASGDFWISVYLLIQSLYSQFCRK